ncbi:alpha-glucuronidase [Bifidobacterium oedipodis]|uniref:Alpha-glucuronidase n=1 Tax=Bifidobacterium oedipodis TaxID=2675322 RepID=A0A7Y0EPM0_9BIFI|nr:alpha-glucuronidase [Bifidobacterium sp. DSM 109957]NMM93718.1 alpha-glucuronidase [Bifidobacterium sp. DSM 109957]
MADAMWLKADSIRAALGETVWYLEGDEDARTIRVRREIVEFLRQPLTGNADEATVLLRVLQTVPGVTSPQGYRIHDISNGRKAIDACDGTGLLYGFYAYVRAVMTGTVCECVAEPDQQIRMIDHWDQIDGSIERGYAGESIFFGRMDSNDHSDFRAFPERDTTNPFRGDFARLESYARLMASIGINAVCLNNVNVRGDATRLIVEPFLSKVTHIADLFDSFGIRTFLAINFASPKRLGGLSTSDPCNQQVRAWWAQTADAIYRQIPAFGGFVVKADSEGEPGPMQYGRTHADGANMLGEALAPHGGIVIWRAFVYNSQQDWRDRSTDRAKAAWNNFKELDGLFADNVALQVKFGPMDFQTREPLNPLIGGMKHTNIIMEFEITAEYLGHQIDVNYVLPQWLTMIDTDTMIDGASTDNDDASSQVKSIIAHRGPNTCHTGFAAVSNVGMDDNWTGNALAQANLYGFGRMCWDNTLNAETIANEWLAQTFPDASEKTIGIIRNILLTSNAVYEGYTAPLGVGFMVTPGVHYGPSVNGYEYDRWGTYHFADRDGVGVDRTQATGSGYVAQYPPRQAAIYEDVNSTPDELLLFFHHVGYEHRLHSGKTVLQHIYDTHFAGPEAVQGYIKSWENVRGQVPEAVFDNVAQRLAQQLDNAVAWRDQVNTFFYRMTKVPDEHGRTIYP